MAALAKRKRDLVPRRRPGVEVLPPSDERDRQPSAVEQRAPAAAARRRPAFPQASVERAALDLGVRELGGQLAAVEPEALEMGAVDRERVADVRLGCLVVRDADPAE